ncbi:hypothetical protein [Treponema sp. J25]|uniref:hypothetical protein n=1 Tax=Treponema sp. J25 TaxID=2094121 RepID=UPI0010535B63|nr:hypothetical protein [Treponema sp. J25]TCW60414.1 hypothetical protein C5O22_11590 [Treponema sp. J25]
MADPELVKVLDYILNRCDARSIEVVAAAVVRRKRDLAMFGEQKIPDPQSWAKAVASQINLQGSLDSIRATVRNMVVEMLRREAPELTDAQIEELLEAWGVPSPGTGGTERAEQDWEAEDEEQEEALEPVSASRRRNQQRKGKASGELPRDLLLSMISQFLDYSQGRMDGATDQALRSELGDWPKRYWKAFPPVIQALIRDYLQGELSEGEFQRSLMAAV